MGRKPAPYTEIGRKVSQLGELPVLADALGLAEATVQGKLVGRIPFSLRDLESLAERFDVPITYFVAPEIVTVKLARCCMQAALRGDSHAELLSVISGMSPRKVQRVLEYARQLRRATDTEAQR
jgi:hypothetical protein